MNTLVCLAAILFLLMILVGGKKGARSFIALFLNFGVLFFTILFMLDPSVNPIILTLLACVIISCINLFYINEINVKTKAAFISTIITVAILLLFIVITTKITMIQGFGEEESDELSIYSVYIGVDFVKIATSVIIMSAIGAITDIAISISSPMREVFRHNPTINKSDLFNYGMTVGRDIFGTSANTLFFAFFGGHLGLLIWFNDLSYSVGEIVNSKVFSSEMVTILCAGIGVALTFPITSWVNTFYLLKMKNDDKDSQTSTED